jgi:hypothetical protein
LYDKIGKEDLEASQQVNLDVNEDTRMLHPEQYNKELNIGTLEKKISYTHAVVINTQSAEPSPLRTYMEIYSMAQCVSCVS